jgi:glycosyltransferase involved in cell wall biosynthesis
MSISISAVLPAYNEEALIEHSVRAVAAVLGQLGDSFEIVVTDDGSRDRTGQILKHLRESEPGLHLKAITHPKNLGYGAALASGFNAASSDLILLLDADRQFDIAELSHVLSAMNPTTDMVIGYRAKRADPRMRLLNAWGWKQLVNGLFGYTARDVDCAFKLFRREVWSSLDVISRGATFSAEFLIKARRRGFRIKEVPVSHFPRTAGSPTGAHPRVIVRALGELLRLRARLNAETVRARRLTHRAA